LIAVERAPRAVASFHQHRRFAMTPTNSAAKRDSAPVQLPFIIANVAAMVAHPESVPWRRFREGIEIHRLHGNGDSGTSTALLRYAPGASVPQHVHRGHEHIFVLAGSQSDERGHHRAGTLVVNAPGTRHSVSSAEGCIVLAIWEQPVVFI
jgi:anti-sigma factor ChrR (cupin superfamily)